MWSTAARWKSGFNNGSIVEGGLTIYYDGTMQEMQDFLSSLGAKEDADSSAVHRIICSDGELEFKALVR